MMDWNKFQEIVIMPVVLFMALMFMVLVLTLAVIGQVWDMAIWFGLATLVTGAMLCFYGVNARNWKYE